MTKNLNTMFRETDCRNKRVIEWISVKDKLPQDEVEVLIFSDAKISIGFYSPEVAREQKNGWISLIPWRHFVTHWAEIDQLKPTHDEMTR